MLGFPPLGGHRRSGGGGESLQTPKVCANHDCYYALAVDSSQPIAPVLRLALLSEETAIIGTWFAARVAAFDGMGNLNEGLLDEGYFIPSQGDEDRYWQSIYMLAQAGTGPALAVPQVIRTPSRVVQPQNHDGGAGHILATLQVRNIQVRAKWDVKNEGNNFTVSALAGDSRQGVLRVGDNIILAAGDYVVTVLAIDEFDYLNESYENLTAMAELTIEVVIEPLRDVGEVVLAVTLIEDVGEAAAYTFAVAGGIAPYSYTFIVSQGLSVNAASGVLSYLADGAVPGVYVVAVSVDDTAAAIAPIELLLTVEVSAALAAALSDGAKDGVNSFVNLATEVGKITPSGGIGAYTFSLVSDNDSGYFTINSSLGVISVNNVPESEDGKSYILVWTLNDGDQRSPEVTGMVSVQFTKGPIAENALRYAVAGVVYNDTINIPVVGGVPSDTGYTFKLVNNPPAGYALAATAGFTITLNAVAVDTTTDHFVTVEIQDSQNPPQSGGTFVLEVHVVPKLTFSDTTLAISQTESASLLSLVNGGNTMYAEDNERTFVVISDSDGFTADDAGNLAVGGATELLGLNTVTVQVMDTVPSQAATATLVIDVLYKEVPVAFDIENSNFPSYIDPDVDLPLSITLKAIGGAQSPSYTFSISENDADWLSIEGGNVLVVKTGAPGGTHTFKIKVVDGASTNTDGTEEDEAEITFTFVKPQAQATANGNVVVSGSESADGSYTSGQTFTFDPKTEQGVTIILGGASDTAVVVAENNQFRITLKYWTPADATEGLSYPEDGEYVFLDGKILAQAIKDGTITVYYFENSSEADEALAVKGGLLAVIAPAGIVDVQGIAIESGVSYIVCRLGDWGTICNFHSPSGFSTTLSATLSVALSDGARDGAYSFVNLTGVLSAVELSGVDGTLPYTFTLLANDNFGIDEDGKNFRITAAFASATVVSVVWVLEDSNPGTPAVSGTVQVEISVPLTLSVALSDGARDGAYSFVNLTGVLPAVELSGAGGIPPYTFMLLANDNFGIDEDGKNFRITAAFASATVVSVVWVLEDSYLGTPAVSGTVQVEISVPLTLSVALSDGARDGAYSFVNLTGVLPAVELSGAGGIPPYTFMLLANDNFGIDEDGKNFRITAAFASATVVSVVWVLEDNNHGTPAVSGTVQVEISVPTLSVALSDGARDGVDSFVNFTGVVPELELSGAGGIPPYTFTLLDNDNFGIDEDGKNFRITAEFASETVVSVVWVLEDSDPGTPAVSGTVQVEIRDIVRPPAMVRDIVGQILISGGSADSTYSTGQTLTFDPNSGGVTVDVQAEGNSAVVWLENAQIRVSAGYIPQTPVNPATGEWIFFSAREIAELFSLSADPEFKGERIAFYDATELKEAFNTPGMAAIIVGSVDNNYVDIFSQVRYVECRLVKFENHQRGTYSCGIQQPTLDLSVALSDGVRDGVHSFVNFTGVVHGVELSGAGGIPPYTFTLLANDNFGIDEDGGNFRITAAFASATVVSVVSVVWVLEDSSPWTPAVSGTVRVEISTPSMLSVALSDGARNGAYSFVNFTGVLPAVELSGVGGIPPYTFTLLANDNFGIDADGKNFRITAEFASATVVSVVWVLEDNDLGRTPAVSGTVWVEISVATLSVALSDGARDGVYSYVKWTGAVAGVELSGAGGISPYTFTLLANDNFGIDADGKNFRITAEFASATVVSVVWVLEDSDPGTPAVSGTVQVEIRDDNFEYVVRPPAMVRDIVGEILISGGGADGTYSAGETPTFDTNSGGVTVDVQADGNSAVVLLENAQIRVSAGYIPGIFGSSASGEWIFFSAREIAELVSLSADPEFKGENIYFSDATELREAFSTPGMVAIIIPSGNDRDIVSQVRYVGCYFIGFFGSFYNCGIVQPTSGFAALSVELSGGARDGVHSFVNLTGVLSAVELSGVGGTPPYTFTLLDNDNFGIDEDGKNFRITAAFASATVVSVVWVLEDSDPVTPAVSGAVQVEISPPPLSVELSDGARDGVHSFVNLTGVLSAVELSGVGGASPYTFTLLANDNFGIDEDGKNFRITVAFASATVVSVVWVLEDSNPGTPAVSGTVQVEVSVPLPLSVALSDGARDGVYSFVHLKGVLSAVELSGVGGILPYTFTLLANDNFGIDEDGKNFRITAAFASATVVSVVWVLEDSDPGTPAVSGTVQVEIRDDGFEYIVRPPAMVRDIVGEILISGGGADGTYNTGETLAFDPNIGGVTVDVQADGNSAVVWLENAQIRVSAKYVPSGTFNSTTGEWIFFSAREIAGLVSLNANPEFKGRNIRFYDATELKEAFSTPGMVAIIIGSDGSVLDIASQVRYVGCSLFEGFGVRQYNCQIQQPTLGFSTTLSVALSDGARDGVHSFVNLTGVLPAVELSGVGGIPPYTFTLLANDNFGIDEDGKNFRITAAFASATVVSVVWVLEDSNPGTPAVSGTVRVEISVPLTLSVALSDGARDGAYSFVNLTGVLSAVELSGVGGIPPYTFTLLANDNFGIDEDGKNFRITAAFASATVVSVVWVLDDSNPGTPAVSGTVQVEISVPALSVALSDGARDGVHSFVSLTAVVPGVELSGVGGIPPYTFTLLANDNFGIDEDGKNFRITAAFASATVVSVVWVLEDSNPGTPAVSGTVEVEIKDELRFVDNSPVVNVTVGVKSGGVLYTAKAQKYENVAYSQIGYHSSFTVDVSDSSAGALVGMINPLSVAMTVTLTIRVVDDDGTQAILTLEVRAFDELSVALSDGARDGVYSFVHLKRVLSAVELSGVGGIPPYTFTLLANDNFGIDEDGKNFRITAAFASATVATVVWVLEDSNHGTPAVSGTVQVEIRDDGFEYIVRPPAMVRDIVGEILISGGDADGTYSTGETLTFDPNIGGVTVDVQANGNSAVVWLENAQIRVSARYIPYIPGFISSRPASGEWIFFSAREIAGLVSLNVDPEFKGERIDFTDATGTELKEAFSTPGMVAIISSEGDISSQVKYVGCHLIEVFSSRSYNCSIRQPTSGFSATLSAALSDGARDGVDSFVKWTGVLPAVELSGVGGIPPYTFTLLANDNFGIDEDGKNFRITAAFASATVVSVVWVLDDSNPGTPAVSGTVQVEVSVPSTLSVALSDGARDGAYSFVNLTGVLSAVELSGVGGIPPYTFTLLANDNFGIDEDGKNFRITAAFAGATVVSVVWVLDDSDPWTPAVSGTVQVEIKDIVRLLAMVSDIEGTISVSGGGADGTYSAGDTPSFDPKASGGVTVDVQEDGNTAKVELENGNIVVNAKYVPSGGLNPATGEWIFFSAREIAELVSLNAAPQFKGKGIAFTDATGSDLLEAYNTPGMVAILIGSADSFADIDSSVRYVGCHFAKFGNSPGAWSCSVHAASSANTATRSLQSISPAAESPSTQTGNWPWGSSNAFWTHPSVVLPRYQTPDANCDVPTELANCANKLAIIAGAYATFLPFELTERDDVQFIPYGGTWIFYDGHPNNRVGEYSAGFTFEYETNCTVTLPDTFVCTD